MTPNIHLPLIKYEEGMHNVLKEMTVNSTRGQICVNKVANIQILTMTDGLFHCTA